MPSILFVCLGNICRSPTAEAVFRKKVESDGLNQELDVRIESAGTSAVHQGSEPDERSIEAGENRGYSFDGQSSRPVTKQDFYEFDYILAMDGQNIRDLLQIKPRDGRTDPQLFLDYAKNSDIKDVPDPYYGGAKGFDRVLDLIEEASDGLIEALSANS
jgi:protein-tyrosine phosphatase